MNQYMDHCVVELQIVAEWLLGAWFLTAGGNEPNGTTDKTAQGIGFPLSNSLICRFVDGVSLYKSICI